MARARPRFGETGNFISEIPKWSDIVATTWSSHLGGTENHFGYTEVLGFWLWLWNDHLGESGVDVIGGTEMMI